jgi:hypothetical protein
MSCRLKVESDKLAAAPAGGADLICKLSLATGILHYT